MPNAVITGLISASTKNGFIHQSGRKYKKEDVVFNTLKYQYLNTKRAASRRSKAFLLHKVSRKYSKNYVGPIYGSIWRPKSNLDWNLVITLRSRHICTLTAQVLMYTPFLRDKTLIFCTGVECTPACFLFAGNVGSLKTQIYKNIQEPKCMAHSFFCRKRFGRGTV